MRKTILRVALCAMALAFCSSAEAQQSGKIPRIGYVRVVGVPSIPGPNVKAFRQGLKDLGYVEGKNILIEFRYAEGKPDRVPSLVAELVQLKVDVLVSGDALQSASPSTLPRRFPLSWSLIRIQLRPDLSIAWLAQAEISRGSAGLPES